MICNYKIQCPRCKSSFEYEVEIETTKSTYAINCPECGEKIKISLALGKRLPSLQMSKTSHSKSPSPGTIMYKETITFKRVHQVPSCERESKIIHPKQSKRSEHTAPPYPAQPEDLMTCPAPEPYTKAKEDFESPPRKSRSQVKRKTTRPKPRGHSKTSKEEQLAPGYEWVPPGKRPSLDDSQERPKKFEEPIKPKTFIGDPIKRLWLAIILLIIVFILGISHGVSSLYSGSPEHIDSGLLSPNTVDIDGTVIDFNTGRPIQGCEVRLLGSGKIDLTNSDGYFLINDVPVGDQEIQAQAAGYSKIIKRVTVASEQPANFNFELKPGVTTEIYDESVQTLEKPDNDLNISAIMIIIFACFAILAIILIWQRNFYQLCVFCTFLSILSFGMGFGFVIGLLALILILLSSTGFSEPKKKSTSLIGPGKVVKAGGK